MPTVYLPGKRKNSRTCIVRGRIDGQQYEIVTTATNKRGAIQEWEAFAAEVRQREFARRGAPKTFAAVADIYLDAVAASKAQRAFVTKLCSGNLGEIPIDQVRPSDILTAAHVLYPKRKAATKNRNAIGPAVAVLNFAADNEWCSRTRVKKLREEQPPPRRAPTGAAETLIEAADGDLRRLLVVLARTGWRISETLQITWDHVRLSDGTIDLYVPKAKKTKTLILHPDVIVELAAVPEQDRTGRLFPWPDRFAAYRPIRRLCRQVGIKVTPHMFRHDFASKIHEAGYGARDIVDVGSWTSTKSVDRYISPTKDHQRRALLSVAPQDENVEERGDGRGEDTATG